MTPEGRVKHAVKRKLKAAGFWFFCPVAGRNVSGIPDIVGCSPKGKFFAIECKATSGSLTPLQTKTINEIAAHGGYAIVVWPQNIDVVDSFLELLA